MVQDRKTKDPSGQSEHGLAALSDQDLVARVANGAEAAFSILVMRYINRHTAMAERVMGNREEAEDAVQDAYAKLWTNAHQFDPDKAQFGTWLYRIVFNQCLDRKRKRTVESLPEGFDIIDQSQSQAEVIEEDQTAVRVKEHIANLPDRQAEAIVLCYFEGLSNKEAADILGVGVKALESLLMRGRKSLSVALASEAKELLESF